MNTTEDTRLTTADFARAASERERQADQGAREEAQRPEARGDGPPPLQHETRERGAPATGAHAHDEPLAPLFLPQMAHDFRGRWNEVQIGFVDDPMQSVRKADELVAQVMHNLAQTFADERAMVESQMEQADTEHLRVALRRYRSFFERLLSL